MTTRPAITRLVISVVTMGGLILIGACGTERYEPTGQSAIKPHDPPASPKPRPIATPERPQHGPCTTAGTALTTGPVEPALGHRAIVLEVRNCAHRTLTFDGYPAVAVLDVLRHPLPVQVAHGTSYMAIDPGPQRISLAPGKHLVAVIAWSATVTDPDPAAKVNARHLRIAPASGQPATVFKADVDLGTTNKLELTAWSTKLAT